ncbi:hypothetical protein AJ79_04672 [Helicocarpus griseus UAMH5409]|uniref:Uncharacterized protein n=1 Tax=Helicocarpus griseus UAMH5409 TaxID=1447875 RepID=A0A2B7XSM9_9EURO|nr:hypothetical protein AJ79_04672 [Helicocarpus griseus UAMH5409]
MDSNTSETPSEDTGPSLVGSSLRPLSKKTLEKVYEYINEYLEENGNLQPGKRLLIGGTTLGLVDLLLDLETTTSDIEYYTEVGDEDYTLLQQAVKYAVESIPDELDKDLEKCFKRETKSNLNLEEDFQGHLKFYHGTRIMILVPAWDYVFARKVGDIVGKEVDRAAIYLTKYVETYGQGGGNDVSYNEACDWFEKRYHIPFDEELLKGPIDRRFRDKYDMDGIRVPCSKCGKDTEECDCQGVKDEKGRPVKAQKGVDKEEVHLE